MTKQTIHVTNPGGRTGHSTRDKHVRPVHASKVEKAPLSQRNSDPTITAGVQKVIEHYGDVLRRLADE